MNHPKPHFDKLIFGGDYNPEQWLGFPDVLEEDLRLMRLSHTSAVSVGIFSWVSLEPEEGRFEFGWLDERLDALHKNGQQVILATPSGAKPNWMAQKYEEIRRVGSNGIRDAQGYRHNHCMTSPVYRQKVTEMNTRLADRYGNHPALMLWHISNEYGGYCYCGLCMEAFRTWLEDRYQTLEKLNDAWWTRFWSHTYTDWDQIQSVDSTVNGMVLDWRRFMTDQVANFIDVETAPIRRITPEIAVTANFMSFFQDYDYHVLKNHIDIVCWDAYPEWHSKPDETEIALNVGFQHDMFRGMLRDRPWLLMECTPSSTNWQSASRPKRPGVHKLSSLQAIAHGSDGVMHFQMRKSLGSMEQYHGAFIDHVGHENNRVFREIVETGDALNKLADLAGTVEPAEAAIIFDWSNWWALDGAFGPRNSKKDYAETCIAWYRPLWEAGVPVHVISADQSLDAYKIVIAPMLYQVTEATAKRLTEFVERGGILIGTYLTGWVNESTLCHRGGFPGLLRSLFGVWAEEMDVLLDHTPQSLVAADGSSYGLRGSYAVRDYAEVIHAEGATVLATYGSDYYAGNPAVTVHTVGAGKAFFVAGRTESSFQEDLVGNLISSLSLARLGIEPVEGVSFQIRGDVVFVLNFASSPRSVALDRSYMDVLTGLEVSGSLGLAAFGCAALRTSHE